MFYKIKNRFFTMKNQVEFNDAVYIIDYTQKRFFNQDNN